MYILWNPRGNIFPLHCAATVCFLYFSVRVGIRFLKLLSGLTQSRFQEELLSQEPNNEPNVSEMPPEAEDKGWRLMCGE